MALDVASFFWIQSLVRDDGRRTLLFDMDVAIQRITQDVPDHPSAVQLTGVYHNLLGSGAESLNLRQKNTEHGMAEAH